MPGAAIGRTTQSLAVVQFGIFALLNYVVIPKGVSEPRVFISGQAGVPRRAGVARLGWEQP